MVVFVLAVLAVPLAMKWYYPLLVLCWNAAIWTAFLPGRAPLWVMLAFIGLFFAVLGRAVSPNARFVIEPSVTKSLLVLTGVVVVTGLMTGGFGVSMLGSNQFGGRNYFFFLAAVAGYFVLSSRQIPPQRAALYVTLFFLPALSFGVSELAGRAAPTFELLWWFLMPQSSFQAATWEAPLSLSQTPARMFGMTLAGVGVYCYLLARFGMRGLLDLGRPGRLAIFMAAFGAGMLSGSWSFVVLGALTVAILFVLEGLHRTRHLPALLGVGLLSGLLVLPQAEKLPIMAQRALSFLPGKFDYAAEASAAGSIVWRLEMWKQLLPEVPQRLFHGKGWGFDARDFFTGTDLGSGPELHAGTILLGDYHNGPLSVLIPFGLYGALAFAWFLAAGLRVLHRNWKLGNPALRNVNGLLLAAFAAQTVFFVCCFGSLHSDMAVFTGLLSLGVALNGSGASLAAPAEQSTPGIEFNTEYKA